MENNNTATQNPDTQQTAAQSNQQSTPAIDYGKIQQMLDGTLAAKEDTALKAYFRQQGLSQQEVEQAITAFKEQKAANQPDVIGMQNQITETQAQLAASQKAVQAAQVESAATMMAVSLGIEVKTIPYILKMADLSQVVGEDGNINEELVLEENRRKIKLTRAQGGCPGTIRRRRTRSAAISLEEPQAGIDSRISEWGNPAGVMSRHP